MPEIETLGEALPKEIERVLEVISLYEETPYGFIAASMMKRDIHRAHKAMIEGDVVEMMSVYQDLKSYQ